MDASNHIFGIMALAFSLGLIHALDADHIMAVTTLSGRQAGIKHSFGFCTRWAMGHGFALMLISLLVLVLGWGIPASLSDLAEQMVGLVLTLLGLWVLRDIFQRRIHLHFHQHDNDVVHAHWHQHADDETQDARHEHKHSATLVGVLHGIAGSAPLLALLPVSKLTSPWTGMAYVLVFGVGVFIAMLVFGGVLGRLFVFTASRGKHMINILRGLIASGSIIYGGWLLSGAL